MIRTGEVVRLGAISGRRYEQDVGQKEALGGTVAVDRLCVYVRLNEGVDKGDHEEILNWHSVTSFPQTMLAPSSAPSCMGGERD